MNLTKNTVIADRFRLDSPLSRGGMGSVWKATHLALGIPCAVKFVDVPNASKDIHARFEREARAVALLRSRHVVQILDQGVYDGVPYMAMELLVGEDLGKRIKRMGRLLPQELLPIMNQIARALSKAHGLGIVHRDLKPDNIFLVKDDDGEIAKVLDFGVAKSRGLELGGGNTKTGALIGTPFYMSPEQAQGLKAVDLRSDLWSLAVIAYQCLTGKLPFESEALGDLLMKIIFSAPPVPSRVATVPPGFNKWWAKAAAHEPAERFQSVREFCDSLAVACGVALRADGAAVLAVPAPSLEPSARESPPESHVSSERTIRVTPCPALTLGDEPTLPSYAPMGATHSSTPPLQSSVAPPSSPLSSSSPSGSRRRRVAAIGLSGVVGLVAGVGIVVSIAVAGASGHVSRSAGGGAATPRDGSGLVQGAISATVGDEPNAIAPAPRPPPTGTASVVAPPPAMESSRPATRELHARQGHTTKDDAHDTAGNPYDDD